jgi:site-specific DNA-methyltransferase (cytosine-N4-specific)
MPLALARKLVRFLTDVGQLVVDPFAGSMTTPLACELEDRPWVATEMVYDYVRGGAERFTEFPGYSCSLPAASR